jgi:hypothetical protein
VPEHRFGFRVFAEQAAVDQRRQILATLCGWFEALLDRIGVCHQKSIAKKEQGEKPCSERKKRAGREALL